MTLLSGNFYHHFQQQLDGYRRLPPVDQWNPSLCGDIAIRIDSTGNWLHDNEPIQRQSLVDLFSSILKREDNDFYLVTPVEKWRIQVDVAPLLITSCSVKKANSSEQIIVLQTQQHESFTVDANHPLLITTRDAKTYPTVMVRNRLDGLVSKNVYYELAMYAQSWEDLAVWGEKVKYFCCDESHNGKAEKQMPADTLGLVSNGLFFALDKSR